MSQTQACSMLHNSFSVFQYAIKSYEHTAKESFQKCMTASFSAKNKDAALGRVIKKAFRYRLAIKTLGFIKI